MAALPARIKVGPFQYTVSTDPEELREAERAEGTGCLARRIIASC